MSSSELLDLKGESFGKLKVVEYNKDKKKWMCECSCGNTTYKRSWDLRNGKATSCGCIKGGEQKRIDLTNKRCGYLTPLEYIGEHQWKCRCDCGNITIKTQTQLKNKNISCGCKINQVKRKYSIGDKIGKLTIINTIPNGGYLCECECTNIEEISTEKIQRTKECSKCTQQRLDDNYSKNRINLLGKRFGDLEAIGYKQELHKWICKCSCGNTIDIYSQHLRVGDTRSCGCKFGLASSHFRSYLEQEVYNYIKSIYTGKIIQNHRGILDNNLEIDIYLPEYKIGIEINGDYCHSNNIKQDKKYHQNKTISAAKKGIRLIHIFEHEWRTNQKALENYLNNILNINKQKHYARKLSIVELKNEDTKEFLNNNHLQGYTPASINIGLKNDKELLGVLTLGKPRFNIYYEYEIIRLCFKGNNIIVGGTERMFKYFLNKYKPSSVISYCNISKFTGNNYLKLGFKVLRISEPNYIWLNIKTKDILARYQTQKHKLISQGLGIENQTEDEIMGALGYAKIYDSGNLVLIYNQLEKENKHNE